MGLATVDDEVDPAPVPVAAVPLVEAAALLVDPRRGANVFVDS